MIRALVTKELRETSAYAGLALVLNVTHMQYRARWGRTPQGQPRRKPLRRHREERLMGRSDYDRRQLQCISF